MYVADTANNRIQKSTSEGEFLTKWGSEGSGDGEFDRPHGISIDKRGNVYVVDTENNRIQTFSLTDQDDFDCDNVLNDSDNCPYIANPNQEDFDGDGIGDVCDNCPNVDNNDQNDSDRDLIGDVCDDCPDDQINDIDNDGICGDNDNCPYLANPNQEDSGPLHCLGVVAFKQSRFSGAEERMLRAIGTRRSNSYSHNSLGSVRVAQAEFASAAVAPCLAAGGSPCTSRSPPRLGLCVRAWGAPYRVPSRVSRRRKRCEAFGHKLKVGVSWWAGAL